MAGKSEEAMEAVVWAAACPVTVATHRQDSWLAVSSSRLLCLKVDTMMIDTMGAHRSASNRLRTGHSQRLHGRRMGAVVEEAMCVCQWKQTQVRAGRRGMGLEIREWLVVRRDAGGRNPGEE